MGSQQTGAEVVAQALKAAGVKTLFGLPGIHNLALYQAINDAGLRLITSRHEQGAAYAADGIARVTGELAVAVTTTGPGATNALTAIGEAWASHSPVLLIATDIPTTARRAGEYRGVLHECIDQAGIFRPVVKSAYVCDTPERITTLFPKAIATAMQHPRGPVYVEIPTDLLDQPAQLVTPLEPDEYLVIKPGDWLERCTGLLAESKRPALWIGGGGQDSGAEIRVLAERLQAPVFTTYHARNILPRGHPLLVPAPPHEPAVAAVLQQADLLLVAGSDLDAMMTQGWRLDLPSPRIAINIDPRDAVKNYAMDVVVSGGVSDVAVALTQVVPKRNDPWALPGETIRDEVLGELSADSKTREAAQFLENTTRVLPENTVVFTDMAICGYWLSAYFSVAGPRHMNYAMGWGTLGFALPAAIGAAAVSPHPVVSFCGDGGALFAIGELATIAQENFPLTMVVMDDGGYGMMRFGHEQDGRIGSDLKSPDFVELAHSFGIDAAGVTGVGNEYADALKVAVEARGPYLLHVKAGLYPPRVTSPRWPLATDVGT
jgi:acetolactate synthase-1/2/3 large subunit